MKTVEFGSPGALVILLLHGGGLSWWNYKDAAQLLMDRYHVVIPLLHGHAGSEAPFTSIEDTARDLIALIDQRFGGRVLLIGGLSLGGQVLTEMLAQRSDLCRFAVIESALALPMRLTAALIQPAYALCYPLVKKRWFARLQFRALRLPPALFEAYFADTAAITRQDMTAFLAANSNYCIKSTLAGCTARTLVLVGGSERPIMKRSAKKIAACLPHAQLEVLPGYAHGQLSINHADRYVQTLLRLIGS